MCQLLHFNYRSMGLFSKCLESVWENVNKVNKIGKDMLSVEDLRRHCMANSHNRRWL